MFLLILLPMMPRDLLQVYLHSTMFLLIRKEGTGRNLLLRIYIPQCFY